MIYQGYKTMVPKPQDNRPDHSHENMKTLLDLSVQWNSLKGVKQVLKGIKDTKEEPEQVSPFSRLLSDEYTSLLARIIHDRVDFLSFRLQFCAMKEITLIDYKSQRVPKNSFELLLSFDGVL
jgi:hypothetical protein